MASKKVRLAALRALERDGRLTPEELVRAASHPKHPLHKEFIWDDKRAAHLQRLDTARTIIVSVRVQFRTETATIQSVAYVRDPDASSRQQGYISVERLRDSTQSSREALTAEAQRVQSMLERARELAAALEMEDELDLLIESAKRFVSRLRRGPSAPEDELRT